MAHPYLTPAEEAQAWALIVLAMLTTFAAGYLTGELVGRAHQRSLLYGKYGDMYRGLWNSLKDNQARLDTTASSTTRTRRPGLRPIRSQDPASRTVLRWDATKTTPGLI